MKIEAQFTIEQLFTPFFVKERKFCEDGSTYMVPVNRTPLDTGIPALNEFLRCVRMGIPTATGIAESMEVELTDLNGFVKLLTGYSVLEFMRLYTHHKIKLLLRYTNLPMEKIGQMCGFSNHANMTQCFKAIEGVTPKMYRCNERKMYDVGRFRLEE